MEIPPVDLINLFKVAQKCLFKPSSLRVVFFCGALAAGGGVSRLLVGLVTLVPRSDSPMPDLENCRV